MQGDTKDVIQRHIYVFGVWEPDTTAWMRSHVQPGGIVIDVGANIGYFTLLAAHIVGDEGHVHAFEPVPSIRTMLEANVARNAPSRVTVHALACGDQGGEVVMYRASSDNLGNSSTTAGGTSEGRVQRMKIDDALSNVDVQRVTFWKVDCEGDELAVLRGGLKTLAGMPSGAAVLVEISPQMSASGIDEAGLVWRIMEGEGFQPFAMANDYRPARYADRRTADPVPIVDVPSVATDVLFVKT